MVAMEVEGEDIRVEEDLADNDGTNAWQLFKEVCDVADFVATSSSVKELIPPIKKLASLVEEQGVSYEQVCLLLVLAVAREALDYSGCFFGWAEEVVSCEYDDDGSAVETLVACIEEEAEEGDVSEGNEDAECGAGDADGDEPGQQETLPEPDDKDSKDDKGQAKPAAKVVIIPLHAAPTKKEEEEGGARLDLHSSSQRADNKVPDGDQAGIKDEQGDDDAGDLSDPDYSLSPAKRARLVKRSRTRSKTNPKEVEGVDAPNVNDEKDQGEATEDNDNDAPPAKSRPKAVKCGECGLLLANMGRLVWHSRCKHSIEVCAICGDKFETRDEVDDHKISAHQSASENAKECPDCGRMIGSLVALAKHAKAKHGHNMCGGCGEIFATEDLLGEHRSGRHCRGWNKETLCHVCGNQVEDIRRHRTSGGQCKATAGVTEGPVKKKKLESSARTAENAKECPDCGRKIGSLPALAKHAKAKHGRSMCGACGETFDTEDLLGSHRSERQCGWNKRTVCDLCGKQVKDIEYHVDHVHRGAKPSPETLCDVCGKVFEQHHRMLRHKLMVHTTEDSPVLGQCNLCGKTFKSREYYNRHMRNHKRERYPCQVCGKTYHRPDVMNRHFRKVHQGIDPRPFACEVCGKCFPRPAILRNHVRTVHEGARPYTCEVCGSAFSQNSSLLLHKRRVHNMNV